MNWSDLLFCQTFTLYFFFFSVCRFYLIVVFRFGKTLQVLSHITERRLSELIFSQLDCNNDDKITTQRRKPSCLQLNSGRLQWPWRTEGVDLKTQSKNATEAENGNTIQPATYSFRVFYSMFQLFFCIDSSLLESVHGRTVWWARTDTHTHTQLGAMCVGSRNGVVGNLVKSGRSCANKTERLQRADRN